jgi:hypothetical protein
MICSSRALSGFIESSSRAVSGLVGSGAGSVREGVSSRGGGGTRVVPGAVSVRPGARASRSESARGLVPVGMEDELRGVAGVDDAEGAVLP